MRRKVVQQGPATLMVSLPSKWVKQFGIIKGQELDLDQEDGKLIINLDQDKKLAQKSFLNITNLRTKTFNYSILALYVKGVDELEIRSEDPKKLSKLDYIVSQLIGYEIVSQGKNSVMIKDVSIIAGDEFNTMFRRAMLIINQMSQEAYDEIKKKSYDLSRIEKMDLSVNRFMFFCLRILNKIGVGDEMKAKVLFHNILVLEQLGDNLDGLCSYITKHKVVFDKKIIDLFGMINELLHLYQKIFYKFDLQMSSDMENKYREIDEGFEKFIDKTSDAKQLRCVMAMHTIVNQIADLLRNQRIVEL